MGSWHIARPIADVLHLFFLTSRYFSGDLLSMAHPTILSRFHSQTDLIIGTFVCLHPCSACIHSYLWTGFHPVRDTIIRSCVKNYFFECLTSILEKLSYRRYHTLVYEKSQSFPPSLMALTASSPGSEHNSIILAVRG